MTEYSMTYDRIIEYVEFLAEIHSQPLPDLKKHLEKIDKDISSTKHSTPEYHHLLERKVNILEKIQELSSNKKIESLHGLIDQVSDGDVKIKLTEELNTLQTEAKKHSQEIQGIRKAEAQIEAQIKLEQQRLDGLERKSKIWLSFLQRESAASIVGAVVLLLLTLALIVGWESQVLSNGFLVILGYFFGQSSSRNNTKNDTEGTV